MPTLPPPPRRCCTPLIVASRGPLHTCTARYGQSAGTR